MSELTTWVKDNGQEIDLNDSDATIKHAESLGWKRKDESSGVNGGAKSLKSMTKDELEAYARENFEVELDKRQAKDKLVAQVQELIDGNGE